MRIAIIGTGLIGGSAGLALRVADPTAQIVVYDADPAAAASAVQRGAGTEVAPAAAAAVSGADVVLIATPVGVIPSVIAAIAGSVAAGAIVTDAGSTKGRIVAAASALPSGVSFIGGHPMAGSEEDGIGAARPDLFAGSLWLLTPGPGIAEEAVGRLSALLASTGAQVVLIGPEEHDEIMAIVSHLPQVVATSLMNTAADAATRRPDLLGFAATGFRDVTRLAASNSGIWVDICRDNREALLGAIRTFMQHLRVLAEGIERDETITVRGAFEAARGARRALPEKAAASELHEVRLVIPDRPNVLAEVTAAVGGAGVNIEDIHISHATRGGRGVLHLLVATAEAAQAAAADLVTRGYSAEVIKR